MGQDDDGRVPQVRSRTIEPMPRPHGDGDVVAIIPVGTLEGAKSRLGAVLDAEERHELAASLARRTIAAAVASTAVDEVLVITPDDEVRAIALELGARPLRQRSTGLNDGLREARAEALAAGAAAIVILPIDLPHIRPDDVDGVLAPLARPDRPLVVIVPDRHGRGTNALVVAPPDAIDVRFGGDSRAAHAAAAEEAAALLVELGGRLQLDVDTADDLVLADTADPELARG
jgi:2-phospho-L-lactate/phosphoenolpyruvate guanylyltransferase